MSGRLNVSRLDEIISEISALQSPAMFNLIVFMDDPARRPLIEQRALGIAEKHPMRLILLNACDASGNARVSASAVHLGVGALEANATAQISRELSVRDVPTVVWWSPECFIEHDLFAGLLEQADRAVIDSSGACNDESTLRRLLCFVQPLKPLHDLAWMRGAPWREMIAQLFDDAETREDLASLNALEVTSGSTAEAFYLAGWLGSRLGWTPEDESSFRAGDGSRIAFRQANGGEKRRVVRAALATRDSRYIARLSEDERIVELSIEGAKSKEPWFVPLRNVDNGSLIEQATLADAADEVFTASLDVIRELLT